MLTLPQVDSPEPITKSCSNFLPYIASNQGNSRIHEKSLLNFSAQNGQILALSMHNSPFLSSVVKYDSYRAKKVHKYLPATSSEALSSRKFLDLDDWIQNRPKTMPEETVCKDELERKTPCKNKLFREERGKRRIKRSIKNPLSVNLSSEEKSALLMKTFNNQRTHFYDVPSSVPYKTNYGHSQNDITSTAAFKEFSSSDASLKNSNTVSNEKSTKMSLRVKEENNRPHSGRKLPFIKAKKKSYKRCSLCSKKTGLATSYVCRCGKNFCASHRYAEVHNCSYDYKTEGRRILQLNNPVVAASKLPKI
ncbi:AN1-type zinc finger protein 6-like [Stegodyphus dumicola]|uniref:AN1-type zinc finger protein 6-like n=1 Tax=Stegodyphus dumicola TaxID=202533 RepID=UPI0015AB64FB|nr:AN1-type zinc finger protein 6-like [Stegodyphus dumicola]